jgi:F-type H+-transporting ATPase subunit alpha
MEDQVVSIWLGTTGQLDDIEVHEVRRFEREFLDHLRRSSKVLTTIRETGRFEDDTAQALQGELDAFKQSFSASGEGGVRPGQEQAEALADGDVDQEQIVRQRQR